MKAVRVMKVDADQGGYGLFGINAYQACHLLSSNIVKIADILAPAITKQLSGSAFIEYLVQCVNSGGEYYNLDTHWYTDDEVNFLFSQLSNASSDTQALTAMSGTQLTDKQVLHDNLMQFNEWREKDKIFVPVNLNDNHWVLLYVDYAHDPVLIHYFDPTGDPMPEELAAMLLQRDLYPDASIKSFSEKLQRDSFNCAPWIITITQSILNGTPMPDAHFDIQKERYRQMKQCYPTSELYDKEKYQCLIGDLQVASDRTKYVKNPIVILHYLRYMLTQSVEPIHFSVLQALAEMNKRKLRAWKLDDQRNLVRYEGDKDTSEASDAAYLDILFLRSNHFYRCEVYDTRNRLSKKVAALSAAALGAGAFAAASLAAPVAAGALVGASINGVINTLPGERPKLWDFGKSTVTTFTGGLATGVFNPLVNYCSPAIFSYLQQWGTYPSSAISSAAGGFAMLATESAMDREFPSLKQCVDGIVISAGAGGIGTYFGEHINWQVANQGLTSYIDDGLQGANQLMVATLLGASSGSVAGGGTRIAINGLQIGLDGAGGYLPTIKSYLRKGASKVLGKRERADIPSNDSAQTSAKRAKLEEQKRVGREPLGYRMDLFSQFVNPFSLFKDLDRKKACELLKENIGKFKAELASSVEQALIISEFFHYLQQEKLVADDMSLTNFLSNQENIIQDKVIEAYINYALKEGKVYGGWPHTDVLLVLAEIQKINLFIWTLDSKQSLVLSSKYVNPNIDKKETIHIFSKADHQFDKLVMNYEMTEKVYLAATCSDRTRQFGQRLLHGVGEAAARGAVLGAINAFIQCYRKQSMQKDMLKTESETVTASPEEIDFAMKQVESAEQFYDWALQFSQLSETDLCNLATEVFNMATDGSGDSAQNTMKILHEQYGIPYTNWDTICQAFNGQHKYWADWGKGSVKPAILRLLLDRQSTVVAQAQLALNQANEYLANISTARMFPVEELPDVNQAITELDICNLANIAASYANCADRSGSYTVWASWIADFLEKNYGYDPEEVLKIFESEYWEWSKEQPDFRSCDDFGLLVSVTDKIINGKSTITIPEPHRSKAQKFQREVLRVLSKISSGSGGGSVGIGGTINTSGGYTVGTFNNPTMFHGSFNSKPQNSTFEFSSLSSSGGTSSVTTMSSSPGLGAGESSLALETTSPKVTLPFFPLCALGNYSIPAETIVPPHALPPTPLPPLGPSISASSSSANFSQQTSANKGSPAVGTYEPVDVVLPIPLGQSSALHNSAPSSGLIPESEIPPAKRYRIDPTPQVPQPSGATKQLKPNLVEVTYVPGKDGKTYVKDKETGKFSKPVDQRMHEQGGLSSNVSGGVKMKNLSFYNSHGIHHVSDKEIVSGNPNNTFGVTQHTAVSGSVSYEHSATNPHLQANMTAESGQQLVHLSAHTDHYDASASLSAANGKLGANVNSGPDGVKVSASAFVSAGSLQTSIASKPHCSNGTYRQLQVDAAAHGLSAGVQGGAGREQLQNGAKVTTAHAGAGTGLFGLSLGVRYTVWADPSTPAGMNKCSYMLPPMP